MPAQSTRLRIPGVHTVEQQRVADGTLECWGTNYNLEGQPPLFARFESIDMGENLICGVTTTGSFIQSQLAA